MLTNEKLTVLLGSGSTITTVTFSMIPFVFCTACISLLRCLRLNSQGPGLNNPQQFNDSIEYFYSIFKFHFISGYILLINLFFFFLGVILFYLVLYVKLKFRFKHEIKHEIKIDPIHFLKFFFMGLLCTI